MDTQLLLILMYVYLGIGVVVGILTIDSTLLWLEKDYPKLSRDHIKSLPKDFKGFIWKMGIINAYGIASIIHVGIYAFLWFLQLIIWILNKIKKGTIK